MPKINWQCIMFGHVWEKKNGHYVCKRCGCTKGD